MPRQELGKREEVSLLVFHPRVSRKDVGPAAAGKTRVPGAKKQRENWLSSFLIWQSRPPARARSCNHWKREEFEVFIMIIIANTYMAFALHQTGFGKDLGKMTH